MLKHDCSSGFVLYGCETWSLILREGRQLRVLENRVRRRIFEPKREEVTGEWKKLHNEEINYLLTQSFSGDQIKKIRWTGRVALWGEKRCIHGFGGET